MYRLAAAEQVDQSRRRGEHSGQDREGRDPPQEAGSEAALVGGQGQEKGAVVIVPEGIGLTDPGWFKMLWVPIVARRAG